MTILTHNFGISSTHNFEVCLDQQSNLTHNFEGDDNNRNILIHIKSSDLHIINLLTDHTPFLWVFYRYANPSISIHIYVGIDRQLKGYRISINCDKYIQPTKYIPKSHCHE